MKKIKTITEMMPMSLIGTMQCLLFGRLWDAIAEANSAGEVVEKVNASPWHDDIQLNFELEKHGNELHVYQKARPSGERFFLMIVKFEI